MAARKRVMRAFSTFGTLPANSSVLKPCKKRRATVPLPDAASEMRWIWCSYRRARGQTWGAGGTLLFRRKRFSGSYLLFSMESCSKFSPNATGTTSWLRSAGSLVKLR